MERRRVFVSWSGKPSREVGEALKAWLPLLFHHIDVWISSEDLNKGTRWLSEVVEVLKESDFGIVCLTPDNLANDWMLFEAGAISNLPQSTVFTFLHGVEYAQVRPPLSMFNHTKSERSEVRKMATALNKALGEIGPEETVLSTTFEKFWPDLEERLNNIQVPGEPPSELTPGGSENQGELVSEILTVVRDTARRLESKTKSTVPREREDRPVRDIIFERFSRKLKHLGVQCPQMSIPVGTPGGISIRVGNRDLEIPIGEAANLVDGILKPMDFLKQHGL